MTSVVQAVVTQSEHEQMFTIHPEDRPILEQHPVVSGAHEVAITVTLSVKTQMQNLFKEVPSLGVAADMVMAVASIHEEPVPNFHVTIPAGSQINQNLTGMFMPIGPRRVEIRQRLAGYDITATAFPEYVEGTRFHLCYIKSISDIVGQFETFRVERVCFQNMTRAGGDT